MTRPMLDFLGHCVKAHLNCLISGGTGAGKTTLLNVMSSFIGEHERIATIEDAAELQLHQEHVVRLETRPPNVEGKGAVKQRQLVINALRMRPDRIVVGEVRGEEALDMLQAMNTGHDGSLTTVHANTPRDALSRIETMIAMGNVNLPEKALRQQISSAIQLVVQQSRLADGSRKVTSISEITGMEGDVITMQEIFMFEKMGMTQDGKVIGRFKATGVRPKVAERLKAAGIHLPLGHVRRHDGGAVMAPILIAIGVFVFAAGAGRRRSTTRPPSCRHCWCSAGSRRAWPTWPSTSTPEPGLGFDLVKRSKDGAMPAIDRAVRRNRRRHLARQAHRAGRQQDGRQHGAAVVARAGRRGGAYGRRAAARRDRPGARVPARRVACRF